MDIIKQKGSEDDMMTEDEIKLAGIGRNKKVIEEYIRNQLEEDYAADQISIKEFTDPFTGDKRK